MCGRFTRTTSIGDILQAFGITEIACDLPPSDNIAPTEPIAVITDDHGSRRLIALRWGLIPSWAKDPTVEDAQQLHVVLEPFSEEDMEAYEVSRLVNSPRNNSPACLELVERE